MTQQNGPTRNGRDTIGAMEIAISWILRVGVMLSLAVVVVGTVLSFVHHPDYVSSKVALERVTGNGAIFPHSVDEVWGGVKQTRGSAIVLAGLFLLIATPVMRVAVSIIAFAIERDWIFVVVTSTVLGLLMLSFLLGRAG
jgi:uncharacterized membrane protein